MLELASVDTSQTSKTASDIVSTSTAKMEQTDENQLLVDTTWKVETARAREPSTLDWFHISPYSFHVGDYDSTLTQPFVLNNNPHNNNDYNASDVSLAGAF